MTGKITKPAAPSIEPGERIDGQLLMDMFYTMALNNKDRVPNAAALNHGFLQKLCDLLPDYSGTRGLTRDMGLQLRVVSLRSGSLIMRHGARPYLEEVEDGIPTVTGLVTSFNVNPVSFSVDPEGGREMDKDREVTVTPFDLRTLEPRVSSITVVGSGYTITRDSAALPPGSSTL